MSNLKEKDSIIFYQDLSRFLSQQYKKIKELSSDFSNEDFNNKLIEKIAKLKRYDLITGLAKYMNTPPIDKLTDIIISSKDPATIYDFSENAKNVDINRLVDALIAIKPTLANDGYIIMYLSMLAEKCDKEYVDKITEIVIERGTARKIICFASNVDGANLTKLAYAVIKKGTALDMFTFSNEVYDAPVDILGYAILQSGDAECIFNFAKEFPSIIPVNRTADALIECNNIEYIYYLAKEIPNAPISEIVTAIIRSRNAKYIFLLASIIDYGPERHSRIRELAQAIVQTKDAEYIYKFAVEIPKKPISILEDGIIECGNMYFIIRFAANVKGCNLDKLTSAACNIANSHNYTQLIDLAKIEPCPIVKITNKFLEFASPSDILRFIRDVHCYSVPNLVDSITTTHDSYSIYTFAKNVDCAPIEQLAYSLVSCQDKQVLDNIVLFAKDIPNAPIQILADAIIKSENARYILKFASEVKKSPIKDLAKAIIDTKKEEYINKFVSNITMDSDTFKLFIDYYMYIDIEKYFNLSIYHSLYYGKD